MYFRIFCVKFQKVPKKISHNISYPDIEKESVKTTSI